MEKMDQMRKITLIVFLIIASVVIFYLNNRIAVYDMRFYSGKDDGYSVRLESICLLSALFFLLMCKQKRILNFFLGFVIGIISSIVYYFVAFICFDNSSTGLLFHILSCLCFVVVFFLVEKRRDTRKR
jgi:Na+/proline symporter